jgi:hypothetical protein
MSFPRRAIPPLIRVEQKLSHEHLPDVRESARAQLLESGCLRAVKNGSRIAITAGSRGLGGFRELLAGVIDAVKAAGGEPFIIPAMGSHGGATAEGQTEILKRFGVTEESLGVGIRSTMHTQQLGPSETGAVAHLDQIAAEADGIIVLGRVKTHPENTAGVASGLLKMVTVGLGKQAGAQEAHSHGLWESVKAVPKLTMNRAKILCGVSVVENAYREPVVVEIVPPAYDAFREADERLLKTAKQHVAKIPFKQLDALIVDELGKSISGTGMDLNVIGKWRVEGGSHEPDFRRIVALSLTYPSLGNGLGIGLADFTTKRFMNDYDPDVTYTNLLTASEPEMMNTNEGPLPLALSCDREAIEVALYSSLAGSVARICRIKNTACLHEMWVSEPLLEDVKANSNLEIVDQPKPLEFNHRGDLF